jgi:hypothetical protein
MSSPALIAIHGFKQSGKDTLAQLLVTEYGYTRVAFADRVKDAIQIIFGVPRELLYGSDQDKQSLSPVRWDELQHIERKTKDHPDFLSVRELMQIFATEICRDKIPGIWCQYLQIPPQQKMVVSDLRFENEADFLRRKKSIFIKVKRPAAQGSCHASEVGLPDESMDFIIENDGELDDFLNKGRAVMQKLAEVSNP